MSEGTLGVLGCSPAEYLAHAATCVSPHDTAWTEPPSQAAPSHRIRGNNKLFIIKLLNNCPALEDSRMEEEITQASSLRNPDDTRSPLRIVWAATTRQSPDYWLKQHGSLFLHHVKA